MKTAIAIVLLLPSLFFVWLAVRGMWRYYRDQRPMATRKPWDDPRCSLRMHSRIVSGK